MTLNVLRILLLVCLTTPAYVAPNHKNECDQYWTELVVNALKDSRKAQERLGKASEESRRYDSYAETFRDARAYCYQHGLKASIKKFGSAR
jgi:hypothetical protein